jgi:ABC-type uncharacterized transport system involved in gliding motility auxiliary subunit
MDTSFLKSRQAKYGAYASVYIIVILAVLGAINFLANRYTKSYDSTSNKQFSLSDQTIKIASGLKNDVKVTYFDDQTRFPQAKDLLDRYAALSTKLKVEYIDPVKKPQVAKSLGYRRDLNIMIASNGRQEEAKSLTEEEVTGALIRSQKSGERNVCFVNAAGEKSIDEEGNTGFSLMKQLLTRDNYKTKTVNLRAGGAADASKPVAIGQAPVLGAVEVPKDCLTLVAGGPTLDYPQPVVDALKAYVEGGGHLLLMLDTPLKLGREGAASENTALLSVLSGWGVTPGKDLVLDLSGIGNMFGAGPEIPIILQYESSPITRPLARVPTAFPLTRSLDVKAPGKGTADKLIATTDDSIAVDKIGPGGQIDPKQGKKGPFTLAASGTTGTPGGRWVVTGTSGWAENRAMGSRSLGNRDLFMNMINWLTADEDLISIRPKSTEDRPLTMTAQKVNLVFWLSIVIFPLGIVGLGLATWWKRR